jgi:hypothetical protein
MMTDNAALMYTQATLEEYGLGTCSALRCAADEPGDAALAARLGSELVMDWAEVDRLVAAVRRRPMVLPPGATHWSPTPGGAEPLLPAECANLGLSATAAGWVVL